MQLIGLTGGIASGKSLVSSRLAEHGAIVVDADLLAREVVEPGTPALERIAAEFGADVIAADGSLDRAALGNLIFADAEKRALLNSITHPAVAELSRQRFAEAAEANPAAIVVYDVPLLVEAGRNSDTPFDLIVVVHAGTETRLRRLMEKRGLNRDEAMHRLNSQASDAERLAVADVVIDNDGGVAETLQQVDALWQQLAERSVSGRT
ncbi:MULTISPECIES: dephospho-CoA kinase [unclassified Diaminobutyricimonas]|uniref:dephospho-CoA kinase n=1 Tax=unclassified Diaminobutyricimonas TaxID=2643261 RepID=UPI0012F52A20|nr:MULTISPECIES: dephospho-CoA kinase [unclassified Diaminobutyricimonas]